ncbi:MAG TPA: peptide ABC transporter substrate-binding protein [Candidatus Baltobacteraceae bacterium]|jgi:peptide/nickel transport system substrate-binding protein|nr:peptide ABC transporter substrate-binding protein [Candidatus Baltobacteraceae bacterium]
MRPWAAALLAVLFLASCAKEQSAGGLSGHNAWTRPGILRFAENEEPSSLDPMLNASAPTGDLSMFIYSYAVRYDDRARPVPDALRELPTVENGDVSNDGLTLKYKLRHNIKWQDGAPLTCRDLRFTWQAVMNPHNNVVTTDGYKDIRDIDCSDPYVAVVHMKKIYAPYLQQLWGVNSNAAIVPEHLLAKYNDDKGSFNTAAYQSMPIGSGPFKVVEWQRGSFIRLRANPDFYLGKPKLKEVIFRYLPDESTEITSLQTHEIDLLARGTGLNWPRYVNISGPESGVRAIRVDDFLYTHVDFNLQRPLLQDRNVRLALAYATDRNEILNKVMHDSGIAAQTDQSPELSWAYTGNFERHDFDQAKARQILDSAGWRPGSDGIRVKNGERLSFNLTCIAESNYARQIETVLQRQWHEVGAEALIKNSPSQLMFQNGAAGTLQGGHYDVALFSWLASADPDDSAIYSGDNLPPHGQNALFWNNPEATAAMNDALKTLDRSRRKHDYDVVQQQMAIDVPTIVLFFWKEPYVYNTDLKGFKPSPVISAFWNPWEYSI